MYAGCQDEIELFHNHDHINAIKLEKAAWETADAGRAERARKLRLEVRCSRWEYQVHIQCVLINSLDIGHFVLSRADSLEPLKSYVFQKSKEYMKYKVITSGI